MKFEVMNNKNEQFNQDSEIFEIKFEKQKVGRLYNFYHNQQKSKF